MALTRLCGFCYEARADCVCPDTEARATVPSCCDDHGTECDPADLCCPGCTEEHHGAWTDGRGVRRHGHPPGETCSAPGKLAAARTYKPDWRSA